MTDRCPLHGVTDCAPCGVARVRAALATANRPATQPTDTNPTRARALARARKEKR